MSFARSILSDQTNYLDKSTVTTYEKRGSLSQEALSNAQYIKGLGFQVFHGVDATKLDQYFRPREKFDTIIFQFPNIGCREPKYGHNPNHILIRNFLRSAGGYLKSDGKILITAVDTPYYHGVFQFDEAADFAELKKPQIYPFDPRLFIGYSHTNTNDDESALDDHRRFVTWLFRLKS